MLIDMRSRFKTFVELFTRRRGYRPEPGSIAYKSVLDHAHDGVFICLPDSNEVRYINPSLVRRLRYTVEESGHWTLYDLFAEDATVVNKAVQQNIGASAPFYLHHRCKDGSVIESEVRCFALDMGDGLVHAFMTRDISVNRKAEQQLLDNQHRLGQLANHDQLTGLPNRHYLSRYLPDALELAKVNAEVVGVVFLDLDRFKHINDTYGHETGDRFLQAVAKRLQQSVRDVDVVIRMGGDEFIVVLRQLASSDDATRSAQRIVDAFIAPIELETHRLQTSASVGVSIFPRDGNSMSELLKHADTAMYQAKDRGRNNLQMFSTAMNRKLQHRVTVETMLREAFRLKQLDVFYQPFVNLTSRKVVGLEALIRWHHPEQGMIPPDWFIPIAEETGLVVPLGNFVLHRVLQDMSAWRREGAPLVPVSLNIAPAQLVKGELQTKVRALLKAHDIPADLLLLEMTERGLFDSRAIRAGENRLESMGNLRELGVRIAIDDFGTGYSSLSYLKHWRVDVLKIDKSFVRELATDSSDMAIVSAIIAIAKHMHIEVIAEGIEAYQQAEILRALGCHHGQGYLFARPMPASKCAALLSRSVTTREPSEDILASLSVGTE
jgi:diguanylate cyclase (GGDEF)-like protein